MTTVYCQMLGDAIPNEVCGEEQGQRGCKNCKAPTRRCQKCKTGIVTHYSDGWCTSCAPTVRVAPTEEKHSPPPERPMTFLQKIRLSRAPPTLIGRQSRKMMTVVGSTYSISVGLRYVIYLTPPEFALWNWVVSEHREDSLDKEIMLPPGPRGLRRSETQESLALTAEEYWGVVDKFQQAGLLQHVRTIGERLSYYRVCFNPRKYHVVRIASRVPAGLTVVERTLIDTVQEGEFDVPEFAEVQAGVKEWILGQFPVLNPLRVRAKLIGYVLSKTHRSWGILYLHSKSQRCLICRRGFEPYNFFLVPELVS